MRAILRKSPAVLMAALVFSVAGCTANSAGSVGDLDAGGNSGIAAAEADSATSLNSPAGPGNTADGETDVQTLPHTGVQDGLLESVRDLPLINTSSVLFPQHVLTRDGIDAQKAQFLAALVDIPEQEIAVTALAHIRSGPGTTYDVTEIFGPGESVTIDGQLAHWYRLADGSGFIAGENLDQAAIGNSTGLAWQTTVTNSGDSVAVDACTGGLTEFLPMSADLGVPSYAMHSYCGGEPVLDLQIGDVIAIDDLHYRVATIDDYPLFGSTELMQDAATDAYLQVGDLVSGHAHTLGLEAAPISVTQAETGGGNDG
jgi:hypothetical protein